jgi:tetratricopeptide (TPR) repeat protein
MNLEKLKDSARKFEQKEEWRKAIDVYLKAIQQIESGAETSPDLSLYNRVGDLYLKINDTAAAVRSYERAVDLYADQGFFNNAIALCGKILRVNPGRTQTYLKLAQLHARKNVVIEAKRNLIEFLERMNALGQLDLAFQSVSQFADQFSGSQEIRIMLVELLRASSREEEAREQLEKLAGDLEARGDRAGARRTLEQLQELETPRHAPQPPAAARPGDLVFLDTGFHVPTAPPVRPAEEQPQPAVGEPPAVEVVPLEMPVPEAAPPEGLMVTETFADTTSMEELILDPLGSTASELGSAGELGDTMLSGIEHTSEAEQDSQSEDDSMAPLDLDQITSEDFQFEGVRLAGMEEGPSMPTELMDELLDIPDLVAADEFAAEPPSAEVTTPTAGLPLIEVESEPEPDEEIGGSDAAELTALEDRIADDPDNPDLHRELAERVLLQGDVSRGREELDHALAGYERLQDWSAAAQVSDLLVVVDPDGIRHHQKRVELAYRTGDKAPLLEAYLSLADALARVGATDKAIAVYGRVQEHDPENPRAAGALAALSVQPRAATPAAAAPPAARSLANSSGAGAPAARVPAAPPPSAPTPPPAPPAAAAGDFVDLGSMILEETGPRDTRMRIDRREPQDEDEQREFKEILEQFKRGIEENLDTDDYQAHYDLGVAFKEMGLLDEAIAEFQKALRAPEGRLRTSEALGIAFFEKGQFPVAEAVLRRAVETADDGDEAKIGLIYWLGRASEAQGKDAEAIVSYERAMAVDIRFMDLNQRIHRLTAGRRE